MRIAHVFKDFYPPLAAGITRYIADVAEESARRGLNVEVHVAGVRRSRRDILPSGVVVHRHRELGRALSSPLAPGLVREVRRLRADVIHLHMPNPLGELGAALGHGMNSLVVTFHAQLGRQQFLEPLYGPLQRMVLGRASLVLVASQALAEVPQLEPVRSRVRVIPFGVSRRFASLGRHVREDGLPLRVLFVGRLVYYKGIDVLLRAAASMGDAATVTIVGDGPLRQELSGLAAALGLSQSVRFLGMVDEETLLHAYSEHDVFVLPSVSRAEAFGLAMAEAMAGGMPIVSTRLGTATDWVNWHEESGLVIPPGDVAALADALVRLRDPELRRRLGSGARARAGRLFSLERHCNDLVEAYNIAVGR